MAANLNTPATKGAKDGRMSAEYRLLCGIIAQAERDARNGDKTAERWLKSVRKRAKARM